MRLARPVYETLPYAYSFIGAAAVCLAYLDPEGPGAVAALSIGFVAETAALTIFLRRRDYRALSREYTSETIELPSTLEG